MGNQVNSELGSAATATVTAHRVIRLNVQVGQAIVTDNFSFIQEYLENNKDDVEAVCYLASLEGGNEMFKLCMDQMPEEKTVDHILIRAFMSHRITADTIDLYLPRFKNPKAVALFVVDTGDLDKLKIYIPYVHKEQDRCDMIKYMDRLGRTEMVDYCRLIEWVPDVDDAITSDAPSEFESSIMSMLGDKKAIMGPVPDVEEMGSDEDSSETGEDSDSDDMIVQIRREQIRKLKEAQKAAETPV